MCTVDIFIPLEKVWGVFSQMTGSGSALSGRIDMLTWRDYLVVGGTVATITGLAVSIFEGACLLAAAFAVGSVALLFCSYYISEYQRLEPFEKQVKSLQQSVEGFERTLQCSKEEHHTKVKELEEQLDDFRKVNERIEQTYSHLKDLRGDLSLETGKLSATRAQCELHETRKKELVDQIQREAERLALIRNGFAEELEKLIKIDTSLGGSTESFQGLVADATHFITRLRGELESSGGVLAGRCGVGTACLA